MSEVDEGKVYEILNSNIFQEDIWTRTKSYNSGAWYIKRDSSISNTIFTDHLRITPIIKLGK